MEKVKNEALLARLTEMYAAKRKGVKEGLEMKQKEWFYNEENHSFCLRVVGEDGEPTTFIDVISIR